MSIKVRFFASLAESVGCREAECIYQPGITALEVWRTVTGNAQLPSGVLCAVNHSYCELDLPLCENDELAYFPPVTGG